MAETQNSGLNASALDNVIFARVQNGVVMEYPVLYSHIVSRGLGQKDYKQVSFGEKPSFDPATERLNEVVDIKDGVVTVTYTKVALTVDDILLKVWDGVIEGGQPDVPAAVFHAVSVKVDAIATDMLDRFAQERRYSSMISLASYADDPDEEHRTEARRGIQLRSDLFKALKAFENGVQSGEVPVPKNLAQILANFPALTW